MKVYILTSNYNDYDQHGEYYLGLFKNIPTFTEFRNITGEESMKVYDHLIINGGGRIGTEDIWYNLIEEWI